MRMRNDKSEDEGTSDMPSQRMEPQEHKGGETSDMTSQRVEQKEHKDGDIKEASSQNEKISNVKQECQFHQLLGFSISDLSSWNSVIKLLCRPTDPASLGILRILFGLLMMIDIWQERGLSHVLEDYGDPDQCRFPLFDSLQPLPVVWMYVVYLVMFTGELGIFLGLCYRASCFMFVTCYWYLFLLDKTSWNNHSYLYGLIGLLLLMVDANRYWSMDGLLSRKKRHSHVPLWNYALLRFQIFIVYFIAGLKKLDTDWVSGYSMHQIASHYVFSPFSLFLSLEQVSLYIVHLGGLTIDLSIGFLLFFDKTRPVGFIVGGSFHLMNSNLFSIGMFPWTMLATLPLFCYADWPRGLMKKCPGWLHLVLPADLPLQTNKHCVYSKRSIKPDDKNGNSVTSDTRAPPTRPSRYHRLMVTMVMTYVTLQCILPYSHGITKGYNNWTQGLYGYSWDMMIHTWKLQHIKVSYINKDTGKEGYLNPKAWNHGSRWSSHPDMVKQYGECIRNRLSTYDITNIELYVDVWRALNDRFQQRTYDPRVNILEAPWSAYESTPWVLPLLVDLSDWRQKLTEIEKYILSSDSDTDVVFVADFPGLFLENYVQEDLGNTSVTVLKGEVTVELVDQKKNYTLIEGEKLQLPVKEFHNIHTISDSPSCYMYIFVNTTDVAFKETVTKYDQIMNGTFSGSDHEVVSIKREVERGPHKHRFSDYIMQRDKTEEKMQMSIYQNLKDFISLKYFLLERSVKFTIGAVTSLMTGRPFEDFLNATITEEMSQRSGQYSEQYKDL